MSILERVNAIRTGGDVERCHGVRHQGSYSVASHTWGVLVLLHVLYPEDYARLSPTVLFHDVPEAWVGDIPATTKKYCDGVKTEVAKLEKTILDELELPCDEDLTADDHAKYKACDWLELYLWAKEQVYGGNKHASCLIRELDDFLKDERLPEPARELYDDIRIGVSVEHATDALIRRITK